MAALVPIEVIEGKILLIRGQKVMMSTHLAELYGVETRVLNQAVKRNINRFPEDFMFQLNDFEADQLVSQNVIPHRKYFGGSLPYAFTEQGVAMLASGLKSDRASPHSEGGDEGEVKN
ncbi:MAG: ORF6N domain-containing protein [Nitrospinae bacterium]|nr:ORF6N domain-containing protein [Nitrospinota bacterium]